MILHLVNDEKFIDIAYRMFEDASPDNNECMVLSSSESLTYIKNTPCEIVNPAAANLKEIALKLDLYDFIVVHMLDFNKQQLLQYVSKRTKIVWIGFGADYYDLIVEKNTDLFEPFTTRLFKNNNLHTIIKIPFYRKESFIPIKFLKKVKRLILGTKNKAEVIDKIDFFAPVLNSEYDVVKEAVKGFKPKFIDWNYGTLGDDLVRGFENVKLHGKNILVGNSAYYENNHLEVFELLKKLDIGDKKIITPLSYGNEEYRDEIKSAGKNAFSENFLPLIDFMSIDKYIETISSCSIVIMNHIRQQAVGNIIIMMYLGATVFLKNKNPVYKFFKEEGAVIYSIEELEKDATMLDIRLLRIEIEKNREVLKRNWSREVAQQKTKRLIEIALGNNES